MKYDDHIILELNHNYYIFMIMMEIVLNFYESPDEDKKPFDEIEK